MYGKGVWFCVALVTCKKYVRVQLELCDNPAFSHCPLHYILVTVLQLVSLAHPVAKLKPWVFN